MDQNLGRRLSLALTRVLRRYLRADEVAQCICALQETWKGNDKRNENFQ